MSTLALAPCAQPGVQWPRLIHLPRPSYSMVATAMSDGHQCQPSWLIARAYRVPVFPRGTGGRLGCSPSGLATCEAIFARCLVRATPTEIGRPSSDRTRRRIALAFGRRTKEMNAPSDVGKGLVDGNPLDEGREI